MHDHDLDLIAAYADDLLEPDQAAIAERLVSECGECRREYQLQRSVKDLLATIPSPVMEPAERLRLRRRSFETLRRRPQWVWRAAVPAALVAILALVGLGRFWLPRGGLTAGSPESATVAEQAADQAVTQAARQGAEAAVPAPTQSPTPGTVSLVDLGPTTAQQLREALADPANLVPSPTDPEELPCAGLRGDANLVILASLDDLKLIVFVDRDVPPSTYRAFDAQSCEPFALP